MSGAFLSERMTFDLADRLAHVCTSTDICPVEGRCPFPDECHEVTRQDWQEALKAIPIYTQET